jgi:hypothetical protein
VAAAHLCLAGLDGVAVMFTDGDPVLELVGMAVSEKLQELRAQERQDLADRIVNALSRALK